MNLRNISIVWDFDGTLTPDDSTSKIIDYFYNGKINKFWKAIKKINQSQSTINWERMLSSDAPTWMYVLSQIAFREKTPLNKQFFSQKNIMELVNLYPKVKNFLNKIYNFNRQTEFKKHSIKIHQFIITAGLKEYIEALVPKRIFSNIWGGRYVCAYPPQDKDNVHNIPVFCMDETMKTRALYEISKGVFTKESTIQAVNKKVENYKLWCPFNNFIYIGDGPTDIPALSLTRTFGGYGIVVYNPKKKKKEVKQHLKNMSADSRCDLITPADFSLKSDLFISIKNRCNQILQKYKAVDFSKETS